MSYLFKCPRDATDPNQNQIHQQVSANMCKLTQATKLFNQSLSMHHGQPKSHFVSTCPETQRSFGPPINTAWYCLYPALVWLYPCLPSLARSSWSRFDWWRPLATSNPIVWFLNLADKNRPSFRKESHGIWAPKSLFRGISQTFF